MGKLIFLLVGAAAAACLFLRKGSPQGQADEQAAWLFTAEPDKSDEKCDDDNEQNTADEGGVMTCQAEILETCRDLDPVTLQGWSRVRFLCEDGEKRKFFFSGSNGLYLASGEKGMLEYRGKEFIGFTKDSGEYVSPLFHVLPEEDSKV